MLLTSLGSQFATRVACAFRQPAPSSGAFLDAAAIAHLPAAVRRYLAFTGALGKPLVHNLHLEFAARMYSKPGARPLIAVSEQYNFFAEPTRLFFMKTRMFGLPVAVLHAYQAATATMEVRLASLFRIVNLAGPQLAIAETVTVLNDMCVFAPASLIDSRLSWREIDAQTVEVGFSNGPNHVSARLFFGAAGELVNFISDDRLAVQNDGSLRLAPWSTPVGNYREIDGRRMPGVGETIWHYPEGDFTYGHFELKAIDYNRTAPFVAPRP